MGEKVRRKEELSEEELIEFRRQLKKYDNKLSVTSEDSKAIFSLLKYVDMRLKEIAWENYLKEKGIE